MVRIHLIEQTNIFSRDLVVSKFTLCYQCQKGINLPFSQACIIGQDSSRKAFDVAGAAVECIDNIIRQRSLEISFKYSRTMFCILGSLNGMLSVFLARWSKGRVKCLVRFA